MKAVFSARSRIAVLSDESGVLRCFRYPNVEKLQPIDATVADRLLRGANDEQVTDGTTVSDIRKEFVLAVENSDALDYLLFLLDGRLAREVHLSAAKALDTLLSREETVDYLKRIMYAKPLPSTANVVAAKEELLSTFANSKAFLTKLAAVQNSVRIVREAWDNLDPNDVVAKSNTQKLTAKDIEGICIRNGLFSALVEKLESKANPVQILLEAQSKEMLQSELPGISHLLSMWVAPLKATYEFPRSNARMGNAAELVWEKESPTAAKSDPAPSKLQKGLKRWDDARDAVLTQVDHIVRLISEEKDNQANEILEQLVRTQLRYPNGERDVVKSLCNIASQARFVSRDDYAVVCLSRALNFTASDPILFFQLGTQLRDLERYDDARLAYDKALEFGDLDDRYNRQKTLSAKAHVLTEQGKFAEALEEYKHIPFAEDSLGLMTAVADVYRKKGDYREAMSRYVHLLHLDKTLHRPRAGKAEIAKRRGDPHRAIRIYNDLLGRPVYDIDSRSKVIYELAKCHLLKRVGQFEKAASLATSILDREPYNLGAHIQLSTILTLNGDASAGLNTLHAKSVASSREQWRVELIEGLTLLRQNRLAEAKKHLIDRIDLAALLSEDKPLATSAVAFVYAKDSQYSKASQLLDGIKTLDRGIHEFKEVLSTQIHLLSSPTLNPPASLPFLPRAPQSIRKARESVNAGNISGVFDHGLTFLLLAA